MESRIVSLTFLLCLSEAVTTNRATVLLCRVCNVETSFGFGWKGGKVWSVSVYCLLLLHPVLCLMFH